MRVTEEGGIFGSVMGMWRVKKNGCGYVEGRSVERAHAGAGGAAAGGAVLNGGEGGCRRRREGGVESGCWEGAGGPLMLDR